MQAAILGAFSDELTKIAATREEKKRFTRRFLAGTVAGTALGAGLGYSSTANMRRAFARAAKLTGEKIPDETKKKILSKMHGTGRAIMAGQTGMLMGGIAGAGYHAARDKKDLDAQHHKSMAAGMGAGAAAGAGLGTRSALKSLSREARKATGMTRSEMKEALKTQLHHPDPKIRNPARAAGELAGALKAHKVLGKAGRGAGLGALAGIVGGAGYHLVRHRKKRHAA